MLDDLIIKILPAILFEEWKKDISKSNKWYIYTSESKLYVGIFSSSSL